MERGTGTLSAVQEVRRDYGIPVISIANLDNLVKYLGDHADTIPYLSAVLAYRQQYGISLE